jgi:hypothetical protein
MQVMMKTNLVQMMEVSFSYFITHIYCVTPEIFTTRNPNNRRYNTKDSKAVLNFACMFPLLFRRGPLDYFSGNGLECPKNVTKNFNIIFPSFPLK